MNLGTQFEQVKKGNQLYYHDGFFFGRYAYASLVFLIRKLMTLELSFPLDFFTLLSFIISSKVRCLHLPLFLRGLSGENIKFLTAFRLFEVGVESSTLWSTVGAGVWMTGWATGVGTWWDGV